MRIAGTASAAPPHFYSQSVLLEAFKAYWAPRLENPRMLERLWANAGVEGRHLVQPMEAYLPMDTWGKANNVWMRAAVDLGSTAICRALANAGLDRSELGALFFVSITGISSPSIDALLINKMGLPLNLRRTPISIANQISSALFADGAAAVVVAGDRVDAPGPRIIDTRSSFYPDTEDVMGWAISEKGFQI